MKTIFSISAIACVILSCIYLFQNNIEYATYLLVFSMWFEYRSKQWNG